MGRAIDIDLWGKLDKRWGKENMNKYEIEEQMKKNRIEADKFMEVCKNCPHNGENCLELDNQCPDQYK